MDQGSSEACQKAEWRKPSGTAYRRVGTVPLLATCNLQWARRWRLRFVFASVLFCIVMPRECAAQTPLSPIDSLRREATDRSLGKSSVADGQLRAATFVSLDRAWVVGDRGLILHSGDGGKSWSVQGGRSDCTYYGVTFADENRGWVVGGYVEPYTQRSVGVVVATTDGGKSWQKLSPLGVARLAGIRWIGEDHLLAWGDWSDSMQSSLIESIDGGASWNARPVPCGHIESIAMDEQASMLIVDRLGNAYRTFDGVSYETIELPTTATQRLRFCKQTSGGWWLGGDAGQLYQSQDLLRWNRMTAVGTPEDAQLISFRDLAMSGSTLWVVGHPGNVVWNSRDAGRTWGVVNLPSSLPINAISSASERALVACGPFATIVGSRNGGASWWTQHQSGSKTALMSISTTLRTVPWNILTYIAMDARRHASALIVHDSDFAELSSNRPDVATRLETAASLGRFASTQVFKDFPVSQLDSGIRNNDLSYYASVGNERNDPMLRRLVLEIRTLRPDVIVVDCPDTLSKLETACSNRVERAIQLAADKDYPLFSSESGIATVPHRTARTLIRSTKTSGLSLPASMVLPNAQSILGDQIAKLEPVVSTFVQNGQNSSTSGGTYRVSGRRSVALSQPLDGLIVDQSSRLVERYGTQSNFSGILQTSKLYAKSDDDRSRASGNPFVQDRGWEDRLKASIKNATPDGTAALLLRTATESRREGLWNRWHAALELLIQSFPGTPQAEAAYWELMSYLGSAEARMLVQMQLESTAAQQVRFEGAEKTTLEQSSPFARTGNDSRANSPNSIQQASFLHRAKRVPIAGGHALDEFGRWFGRWPETWQVQRTDPRWAWLIASRFRAMQLEKGSDEANARSYAVYWPAWTPTLTSWSTVFQGERSILAPEGTIPNPQMVNVADRPFLDGLANESFWNTIAPIPLLDPLKRNPSIDSYLKICCDDEFIYIYSQCTPPPSQRPSLKSGTQPGARQHDRVAGDSHHVRLRIDIDRDYATWYELAWSPDGSTSDQCNDMLFWNPNWYIATLQNDRYWAAEIAIPIDQLVPGSAKQSAIKSSNEVDDEPSSEPRTDWLSQPWAISAVHSIPSIGTQLVPANLSGRMQQDQWQILLPSHRE